MTQDKEPSGARRQFGDFAPALADFWTIPTSVVTGRIAGQPAAPGENLIWIEVPDAEYRGFGRYLRSHGKFEETAADLRRQFRFIGDSGAYHFLWPVGEPTPPYHEWFSASRRNPAR